MGLEISFELSIVIAQSVQLVVECRGRLTFVFQETGDLGANAPHFLLCHVTE